MRTGSRLALLAAMFTSLVSRSGGLNAAKSAAKEDAPTADPNTVPRFGGRSAPFSGGYCQGSSGPVIADRYSVDPNWWNEHQIAAHAKSERRRVRDERNDARRLAGMVRS